MNARVRTTFLSLAGLAALLLPLTVAGVANAQAAGFEGHIQSGTCAAPTDAVRVNLESSGAYDVAPYLTKGANPDQAIGYSGASEAPGFGLAAIYTDQRFSMVITDPGSGRPAACGDILRPVADEFREIGVALVQLLPVEDSGVQGVAAIKRSRLQRELDVTPTLVQIVLSTDVTVTPPAQPAAGYNGHIQGGSCQAPTDGVRIELNSRAAHDVSPYLATPDSGTPVTVAYYGAPGAPGFSLAATYTAQQFSLAITDEAGNPVACGDILEPNSDQVSEAGLALVQLNPAGDSGVQGYALIERTAMQRELDITPTLVRIVIFAPPPATA